MRKVLLGLILGTSMSVKAASVVTVNPARLIKIEGVVGKQMKELSEQLDQLALSSQEPVDILLDSPGGSVFAGERFMDIMEAAQSRGVKLRCVVPAFAASMAFMILAQCDERYVMKRAKLLFHPPRVSTGMGAVITPADAKRLAEELEEIDVAGKELLKEKMPTLNPEVLEKAYMDEKLWTGKALSKAAPGFLKLVVDVKGLPVNPPEVGEKALLELLSRLFPQMEAK